MNKDSYYKNLTLNPDKTTCTLFTPDPAEYKSKLDLKIKLQYTAHVNAPKGLSYSFRPKAHIKHTDSQHLSTRIQTTTNDKSTHNNSMGKTEGDTRGYLQVSHETGSAVCLFHMVVVVVYPLPWPLLVGGVRCSRLWSTSQLLRPSGQQCSHSGGVCPQIQGRQCGAYVGAVEEMMCVVCVDVTEGA